MSRVTTQWMFEDYLESDQKKEVQSPINEVFNQVFFLQNLQGFIQITYFCSLLISLISRSQEFFLSIQIIN